MLRWLTEALGRTPADPLADLRKQVEEAGLKAQKALVEAQLDFLQNMVDPREPLYDDQDFWLPLGYSEQVPWSLNNRLRGEVLPVYLTWYGLKVIRDDSRRICAKNEFAINALTNRVSYTVGKGMGYEVVPRKNAQRKKREAYAESWRWKVYDEMGCYLTHREALEALGIEDEPKTELCWRVQDFIDEWIDANDFHEREQECAWRYDEEGEFLLRFFHLGGGKCVVRAVEPELVYDQGKGSMPGFGVQTAPGDVEDVTGYWVIDNPDASESPELVPADEVLHVKANVKSTSKRGLPTVYAVRKNLERADKLLRNMSIMAQVRATFAVLRKHKQFSAQAIQAFQQAQADLTVQMPVTGKNNFMQQLLPGSIVDTSQNTEYEFPGADVDASSFVEILQAELRAVAARFVMPEYMLTSNAENANYSSTLVAEAPAVKNFERLQSRFGRAFGDGCYGGDPRRCGALWRAIRYAVEYGRLPAEALTDVEIQCEGPSLVVRDRGQETQRHKTLHDSGVLSRATWAKLEGLEFDQEQQQLEQEGPPPGQPQEQPPAPGKEQPPADGQQQDQGDNDIDPADLFADPEEPEGEADAA